MAPMVKPCPGCGAALEYRANDERQIRCAACGFIIWLRTPKLDAPVGGDVRTRPPPCWAATVVVRVYTTPRTSIERQLAELRERARAYDAATELARWTVRLLLIHAGVILFLFSLGVSALLESGHEEALSWSGTAGSDCLGYLIALPAAILFFVWQYRLHENSVRLAGGALEATPGWGVAWWFVPLANLFMPFLVLQELWRANTPGAGLPAGPSERSGGSWRGAPSSGLISFYWCLRIANVLVPLAVKFEIVAAGLRARGDGYVNLFALALLFSQVPQGVEKIVEIFVVEGLTRRQEQSHRRLQEHIEAQKQLIHEARVRMGDRVS